MSAMVSASMFSGKSVVAMESVEAVRNRILICGSCVSRDILNFDDGNLFLVDYSARSSFASAFNNEVVDDPYSAKLASPFQQRIVAADFSKQLAELLEKGDYDTLLVDFIDERFDLFRFDDGAVCTLSDELLSAGFLSGGPAGQVVKSGSDEFLTLWMAGWDRFWSRLGELGFRDRLRLNCVFWSSETIDGEGFLPAYSEEQIDAANALLSRLYEYAKKDLADHQVLEYSESLFKGGVEHRWGKSPFHYFDEYYLAALRKLSFGAFGGQGMLGGEAGVLSNSLELADYSVWRCALYDVEGMPEFLVRENFDNGIHRVTCGSGTLDFLLQGLVAPQAGEPAVCLVAFGGALSNRVGTRPPYFSGRGVAAQLNLPLIAISDPSLVLNESLPLAWYAGNSGARQLGQMLAQLLDRIAQCHNLRLIIFGGSGGGFASLVQSSLLNCEAAAVAWNPQTSISQYVPEFVVQYLKVAFPELADEAEVALTLAESEQKQCLGRLLERTGSLHSVRELPLAKKTSVLYLQNRHDWHVAAHAKPYLGQSGWRRIGINSFAKGENLAFHLGSWGAGHAPIPTELLVKLIGELAQGRSVAQIASTLAVTASLDEYCPWFAADLTDPNLKPLAICDVVDGELRVAVNMPSLPSAEKVEYALYLLKNRQRIKFFGYQSSPVFSSTLVGIDIDAVQVFVRDFWREIRTAYYPWPPLKSPAEETMVDLNADFVSSFSRPLKFLPQDFPVIENHNVDAEGSLLVRLAKYCESISIGDSVEIDWMWQFEAARFGAARSNVMWLLSLNFVGCLLSSFEVSGNKHLLSLASRCIESFLEFVDTKENRLYVENIASGDHSTSTRVTVFIKYLFITNELYAEFYSLRRRVFFELHSWLEWMCVDENFCETNHGLMCSISLVTASQCFHVRSDLTDKYTKIACSRILRLAKSAFCKDGLCYENTIGYHNYNLGLYRIFLRFSLAQEINFPEIGELQAIVSRADLALRYCMRQDGSIPPVGDSPVYLLKTPSINQSKFFPESGFAVAKNDDFYLSLQCGARTEFHKQMDDSSITLRYKGVDILIDAGSYSYSRAAGFGRYVESSTGHTGVYPLVFDHLRRNAVVGKFGPIQGAIDNFIETDLGVELGCYYKTKDGSITARRQVVVRWPDEVWIRDDISMFDDFLEEVDSNLKVQRFLFGPDLEIFEANRGSYLLRGVGVAGTLFVLNHAQHRMVCGQTDTDIRGWHSVNFGEIRENSSLELISGELAARFTSVLKLSEGARLEDCSSDLRERFLSVV